MNGIKPEILIKASLFFFVGGGILLGSTILIKGMFRDRAAEVESKQDFTELSHVIPRGEMDKASLSSDEVRSMAFQEDFESEGPRGMDSLSFIKKPERDQRLSGVKKPAELEAEKAAAQQAAPVSASPVQEQMKPKPRLKGFGENPAVGSVSGFKMKTPFGGLSNKSSIGSKGLKGSIGTDEDYEEEEEEAGSFAKGDLCKKVCGMQSRISTVNSQSSCSGAGREWIDGMCIDTAKLESCAESNPACK